MIPSPETLRRAGELVRQIEALQAELAGLFTGTQAVAAKRRGRPPRAATTAPAQAPAVAPAPRRRRMTAEGRARIAAAAKARWARARAAKAAKA